MTKECIDIIENEFPNQSKPEDFVDAHIGDPKRNAFANFFQLLIDEGDPNALNDSDAKFTVTFNLSWKERLKVLLKGKYDAMIGPLLSESVGFGICWQHYDILETLASMSETSTEDGE